jgi:hypothetical protein
MNPSELRLPLPCFCGTILSGRIEHRVLGRGTWRRASSRLSLVRILPPRGGDLCTVLDVRFWPKKHLVEQRPPPSPGIRELLYWRIRISRTFSLDREAGAITCS